VPAPGPTVFYEATVLGQARRSDGMRTGIHRCLLELLRELHCSHADLTLVPFSRTASAAADLRDVLQDEGLPLGLAARQARLGRLVRTLLPASPLPEKLRRLAHAARGRAYETAMVRALRQAPGKPLLQDTFLGTPHRKSLPPCHRLVIAYDLIPILQPQHVQAGFFDQFDVFYASLEPTDTVICISEATRRDLLRCYTQLDPERCLAIPLAASEHFQPERDPQAIAAVKTRLGLAPEQPYFLSLCTLEPRKNLKAAVQALARLPGVHREHTSLRLVLVGASGWGDQAELALLAKELGVFDRLLITGYLPDTDLPALYSGAIGFVYPSLYEGFGLPVLEAMQCGTPVITSNSSSLPEVVGEAGVLVDPTDIPALADAMAALLDSPELQNRLAGEALERSSRFSWRTTAAQIAAVYRRLHQAPATPQAP
jgi:glycosyltransferase involved in cell wall biosynthesis